MAGAQPIDPYAPQPAGQGQAGKAKPAPAPVDPYGGAGRAARRRPPAQPKDPYAAPTPGARPPGSRPSPTAPVRRRRRPAAPAAAAPSDVDEAVAASLVARAHQLLDIKAWADAKQLAVEAADAQPGRRVGGRRQGDHPRRQPRARHPRRRRCRADARPRRPRPPTRPRRSIPTPTRGRPRRPAPRARSAAAPCSPRYGIVGGGLLGLAAVGAAGGESSGGADTAGALIGGLVGGGLGWWVGKHYDVSLAHARAVGAGTTWGAVAFGLFTDAVGGSDKPTTHDEVFVGAGVGALVGTFGAAV